MYAKKNADKRIDIKSLTLLNYLNCDRSVYLAENKPSGDQRKRYIVKTIPIPSEAAQFQSSQDAVIRKTFTSSIYYFKPEFYDFKDGYLHLGMRVQPLSLQTLIWIHKKEGKLFPTIFIRDFAVRLFEGIARLKPTEIFPQNLKPSNIFLQIKSIDDRNWVWSEAGLHTVRRNQYYYKINMQNVGKNSSIKVDPYEIEFYSLAIMLVEMITFQSPHDIDKVLRSTGRLDGVENFNKAEDYYGAKLAKIIQLLVQPPKDNSLNKAVQEYKESQEEEDGETPDYDEYCFTEDRLEQFIKGDLIQKIDRQARDHISDRKLSCRDIFEKMAQLDPEFHFSFSGIQQFQELLDYMGVELKKAELVYLATYFTSLSHIRYFKLIQAIFPPKELIESIIAKASQNYDSFKEFFQSQTRGKDFWKVQQIKLFLESLEVPFLEKDISDTVKEWTKGSSKTSIKYPEIYAAFKPIIGMSMSLSTLKKPAAAEGDLTDGRTLLMMMMQKLKRKIEEDKGEDLVTFFRKNDIKQNWTVDSKIYKMIKNYTKDKDFDDDKYRKAFIEMEKEGSIEGDMTKQINYIYLIRNLELEEPLTLLRQVITQKINESNRQAFFQKYEKNERGWTFQSLQEFNRDECLQFDDRQLRVLFSEMDSDRSGTIQTKELFYKLTNLKEFDYGYIVDTIRSKIDKEGIYLFEYFEEVDPKARLVLSNSGELYSILQNLGVQLSQDHLSQLYNKFAKKGRFDYLSFCREFHPKQKLFMSAIRFVLSEHYKGNFDKLYQMGLKQNKKKWSLQSLSLVNEEMVLGFREHELEEIWNTYDPNNQGSLTKQEVANLFNYQFVKTSELTTKALESIKDLPKKREREEKQTKKETKPKTDRHEHSQTQIIQSFKKLGEKQLSSICLKLINASPQNNGQIALQQCITIFQDNGIQQNKKQIQKLIGKFKIQWTKKPSINFIQFYFFLYDQIFHERQESLPKIKANLIMQVIKQMKKLRKISNSDMFAWCKRKDKMRLSDFQEVINKLTEVDVYSEDLESIWNYWGEQEYFTEEDFDNLLQTKEYKGKLERQKSLKQKEADLKLKKKQSIKPRLKLSQENKMIDFINEAESSDTPYLKKPLSFGEKDPTFRRENSNRNSIRQSKDGQDAQDTPINRFKPDNSQRQRQARQQEKKKSAFGNKKAKEQKLELQQFVNPIQDKEKKEQKFKTTYNKTKLLEKFREQVADGGEANISELFAKASIIEPKRFISCLTIHYNFSQEEAAQLAEHLSKFGKIKLDTIKENLYKAPTSSQKESKEKDKGKSREKFERNKSTFERSPANTKKQTQGKKIIDPRRQKINVPLVRQTIKSLKVQFCKRFELNELQPYFFSNKDSMARQEFVTKCQSISTKFSSNICQKIFDYLKPDNQDKISTLSFKLGMGIDQPVDEQEDDYLPDELQKELKIVFEKADRDHSGFIQSQEIQGLLSSLGFNENLKEIQSYFAKMDENFDNRISYNQFRRFIQDQILPQMSDFDQDEEQLQQTLRNNDIFRSGSLAATTFQAVIQRYGVKISQLEVQILVRSLNPEGTEINIRDFLDAVRDPSIYDGKVKGVLYKIRLRKKVQLRQIQKIFENISSCFVLAYTPAAMQKGLLNISSPYQPVLHDSGLFYSDLPIRDARKIGQSEEGLVGGEVANNDILVEIALKQVNGVPIPQKAEIKGNIVRRYLNISFFDLSAEVLKSSIWQIDAQFDPQVEDVWLFNNAVRSIFIKVAGFEARKFEKIVLLFELVIDVIEGNRTLEINCGCSNMPLRQLIVPEGKTARKLKLIAGLPNRSKQIDKNSVSKRSGWKNFFGGDIQSELEIELIHQNKFKQYHRMLASLPSQVILGRKALHYLWVYRQVMAQSAFDGPNVNPLLSSDMRMIAFRLSLDVPEAFGKVCLWWKEKIESRVKSLSQSKKVFRILMQEFYLVFNSKQFELIKRCPCKVILHNKSLNAARNKMISQALENVESWVTTGTSSAYKRRKNYNFNYGPLQIHEIDMPKEHRNFMESIAKLIAK